MMNVFELFRSKMVTLGLRSRPTPPPPRYDPAADGWYRVDEPDPRIRFRFSVPEGRMAGPQVRQMTGREFFGG